jgi:hypothetical protein
MIKTSRPTLNIFCRLLNYLILNFTADKFQTPFSFQRHSIARPAAGAAVKSHGHSRTLRCFFQANQPLVAVEALERIDYRPCD